MSLSAPHPTTGTMAVKGAGAQRGKGQPHRLCVDSHDFLSGRHMQAGKASWHEGLC